MSSCASPWKTYERSPTRTADVGGRGGRLNRHVEEPGAVTLPQRAARRIDPRGNLVLVGRRTDMYIRGGYNVYPAEAEAVLAEHPAVAGVAVVESP